MECPRQTGPIFLLRTIFPHTRSVGINFFRSFIPRSQYIRPKVTVSKCAGKFERSYHLREGLMRGITVCWSFAKNHLILHSFLKKLTTQIAKMHIAWHNAQWNALLNFQFLWHLVDWFYTIALDSCILNSI